MMLNKEVYDLYLEKSKNQTFDIKDIEILNEDISRELIQLYLERKYLEISGEITKARKFSDLFSQNVTSQLSFSIGVFAGALKVFELLIYLTRNFVADHDKMTALYEKANVKAILRFLFKYPDSQHKVISKELGIEKGYLSSLLRELEDAGFVDRYATGKRSFFSVSLQGQAFLKKKSFTYRMVTYKDLFQDKLGDKYKNPRTFPIPKKAYHRRPLWQESSTQYESPKEVQYAGTH